MRSRSCWFAAGLVSGCARIHPVPAPVAVQQIAPDAAPLAPVPPPRPGAESMNTEYFLGDAATEAAAFADFAARIQEVQRFQTARRGQPVQRGFHAKAHACLTGALRPLPQRDPRTRHGLFASDATRAVTVRFSNGVGWQQADRKLDARGMAVEVQDVDGPRMVPDGRDVHDLLMTNSPTPVGQNAHEFMGFAARNARGNLPALLWAARHPHGVAPALADTGAIKSITSTTFWSGGAYHLGAHQAVKFQAYPCPDLPPPQAAAGADRSHPDYLRAGLVAAAAAGPLCWELGVQLQADPRHTPIEDAAVEWLPRHAPILPVARIELPAQAPLDAAACDALTFSPWTGLHAHQPMGHINRARKAVYAASQQNRGVGSHPPTPAANPTPP